MFEIDKKLYILFDSLNIVYHCFVMLSFGNKIYNVFELERCVQFTAEIIKQAVHSSEDLV